MTTALQMRQDPSASHVTFARRLESAFPGPIEQFWTDMISG